MHPGRRANPGASREVCWHGRHVAGRGRVVDAHRGTARSRGGGLGSPSEFLDQHHAQRQQTLELITAAEARGHGRLAEMNRTVLSNLDTIIDTLETPETTEHAL